MIKINTERYSDVKDYKVIKDGYSFYAYKDGKRISPKMSSEKEVEEYMDNEKNEECTQVSDVSTGTPPDQSITIRRKYNMNESQDIAVVGTLAPSIATTNIASDSATPINPDDTNHLVPIPTDGESVESSITNDKPIDKTDNSEKYTDERYTTILNILKSNGYPTAKFYGSEGYLIDNPENAKVKLICRTISEGFTVNVVGGLFDLATCEQFKLEFSRIMILANKLNQILISDDVVDDE